MGVTVRARAAPLVLTNTGAEFIFSDLLNAADSSVEEIVNALNAGIGDRTYSGSILTDGEDIATSLEALSVAIYDSSVTRIIERLTTDVPESLAHSLPGLNAYTVDAAYNGACMDIVWDKQWRDPGPEIITSNDYEETSGGVQGLVAGTITPYEKIKVGDSINYMIRC